MRVIKKTGKFNHGFRKASLHPDQHDPEGRKSLGKRSASLTHSMATLPMRKNKSDGPDFYFGIKENLIGKLFFSNNIKMWKVNPTCTSGKSPWGSI